MPKRIFRDSWTKRVQSVADCLVWFPGKTCVCLFSLSYAILSCFISPNRSKTIIEQMTVNIVNQHDENFHDYSQRITKKIVRAREIALRRLIRWVNKRTRTEKKTRFIETSSVLLKVKKNNVRNLGDLILLLRDHACPATICNDTKRNVRRYFLRWVQKNKKYILVTELFFPCRIVIVKKTVIDENGILNDNRQTDGDIIENVWGSIPESCKLHH